MGSSITHYQPPQLQNHTDALGQALSTPCQALHQYAHSFRDSTRMPTASETAAVQCHSIPLCQHLWPSSVGGRTRPGPGHEPQKCLFRGHWFFCIFEKSATNKVTDLSVSQLPRSPSCQARWPKISQWNLLWWAEAVSFWCLVNQRCCWIQTPISSPKCTARELAK